MDRILVSTEQQAIGGLISRQCFLYQDMVILFRQQDTFQFFNTFTVNISFVDPPKNSKSKGQIQLKSYPRGDLHHLQHTRD
jgi:hypothetical protein